MEDFANRIIDRLGGTTAVARLCDCKPPSVHYWRSAGIPKYRLQFLRLAKPEVFKEIEGEMEIEQQETKLPATTV